jgi:pantoate--beta-alanine ligase
MELIEKIAAMQKAAEEWRRLGKRIGVVPTMGFLHRGHASLIEQARRSCDVVVTTIFVNPTQFAPNEDFDRYPRNPDRDREIALQAGCDVIFSPARLEMYPPGYDTYVQVPGVSSILEGKFRPTHFLGVTTVVAKLFQCVRPHTAFFGQKDAQQAFLIRRMVIDLNFGVEVVVMPIVREPDGLALSSRNVYLEGQSRKDATVLIKALRFAESTIGVGERDIELVQRKMAEMILSVPGAKIDYIAFVRPDTFEEISMLAPPRVLSLVAARIGPTRLIDNVEIEI